LTDSAGNAPVGVVVAVVAIAIVSPAAARFARAAARLAAARFCTAVESFIFIFIIVSLPIFIVVSVGVCALPIAGSAISPAATTSSLSFIFIPLE
jgi:hypothetical protein